MDRRLFPSPGPRRFPAVVWISLAVVSVSLTTGCLHRHKRASRPTARTLPPPTPTRRVPPPASAPPPIVQGEEGIASWYGHPYHGRKTASGEVYDMYKISAAHRTLPFGTRVRVHNLENGRDVDVLINDRGPFVEGRIIDLSYAAAQVVHMPGIALVRLKILGRESGGSPPPEPGIFAVQVGAFKERQNAERLKAAITPRFGPVTIQGFDRGDGYFYRVHVGRERSEEAALELARNLREANFATETFVVRLN